jgi:hypothetical protein
VIFFPANVVRSEKQNRKLPRHFPHVSAGKLANVAEIVARRVAYDLKVENANSEESVLRVRRENVLQEESDRRRVARELHALRERKEIVLYASRENGQLDQGELKALPRGLQSFRKPRKSLRLRHLQFRKPRKSLRLRHLQFRMFKRPRYQKLRHHRHLHRAMALLRASRGDSKPCYWHRHDISTASNIAVA